MPNENGFQISTSLTSAYLFESELRFYSPLNPIWVMSSMVSDDVSFLFVLFLYFSQKVGLDISCDSAA